MALNNRHWLPIDGCKCSQANRTYVQLSLCEEHDARVLRAIHRDTIREEFPRASAFDAELAEATIEPPEAVTAAGPMEVTLPHGYIGQVTLTKPQPGTKIRVGAITIELR